VSTVQEIQEAIAKLQDSERFELLHQLNSQYDGAETETEEMLAEASEGERQIDAGQGVSLEEARRLTRTWITK
jgi:hypothetical protein